MKKFITIVFAGLAFFMVTAFSETVWADVEYETVTLSEEDRYNPDYYQPFSDGGSLFRTKSTESLEERLISAWRQREQEVDVSSYQLSKEQFRQSYYQILNLNPEFIYVGSSYSYYINENIVVSVIPKYTMDENESDAIAAQMDAAASEALSLVTGEMEDYEKALVVHDWLATYCAYDSENYANGTVPDKSHQAYGALCDKIAVCDGYAKAYLYIMRNKLRIPCYLTSSDAINHAWNIIEIGGEFYHVDVTWDDPIPDGIGRATHDNFLLSDSGILETGHEGWYSELQASDDRFDHALWKNSPGSVIAYQGDWYYIDDKQKKLFQTDDLIGESAQEVYAFEEVWKAGGSMQYSNAYSYLQRYYNKLIFNGPKNIYAMPFATKQTEVFYTPQEFPADTASTVYSIYGLKVSGSTMYYEIKSMPNDTDAEKNYIYQTELERVPLQGSVSLEGELRYGSALKAQPVFEEEIFGAVSYLWYRDGEQIAGQSSQEYQLEKEDIGKKISVRVVAGAYSGELTCESEENIQKAIPAEPETLPELSGILGKPLSSVVLPQAYAWLDESQAMEEKGDISFQANYCPDEECYEKIVLTLTVHVIENHEHTEHTWDDGTVTKEPSCTQDGVRTYVCKICNETNAAPLAATGHQKTQIRNQKQATCGKTGYTGDTYCLDCGERAAVGKTIPATGNHRWDVGRVTKEATAKEQGVRMFTCTICGATKTEHIPVISNPDHGNNDPQGTSPPKKGTLFQAGNIKYRVTKTGKNAAAEVVAALGKSKSYAIPSSVKSAKTSFQVTSIAQKAFKNNRNITKITIGSNVKSIGKEAFFGCKKLKTITVKSAKLTSVGKNAIKNIHKQAVIKCPTKKLPKYKKLFGTKSGYKKTMKIKKA